MKVPCFEIMNENDELDDTGITLTTPPFLANIEHDTDSVYGTNDGR